MQTIVLDSTDLGLASCLIVMLALLSRRLNLHLERSLIISSVRSFVQLALVGVVLKLLFENAHISWLIAFVTVMLLVAGYEVRVRQRRRFTGLWGYGIGTLSMFLSTFVVTMFALLLIINAKPWYAPQYAIPLVGMMFGNAMNGVALGLDSLTNGVWQQQKVIEARLTLGQGWDEAIADIRRDSIRSGLIPIINAMAAAGVVSLPGMMTGQILAGSLPVEAVKYQILIMFLIATGTGLGTISAVSVGARRLFDHRQRLSLGHLE